MLLIAARVLERLFMRHITQQRIVKTKARVREIESPKTRLLLTVSSSEVRNIPHKISILSKFSVEY
jgi:hypothetical protein